MIGRTGGAKTWGSDGTRSKKSFARRRPTTLGRLIPTLGRDPVQEIRPGGRDVNVTAALRPPRRAIRSHPLCRVFQYRLV